MVDEHEKPRNDRTPKDYALQIFGSISHSLIELGYFKDDEEYRQEMFNIAVHAHANGIGGNAMYKALAGDEFKKIHAMLKDKGLIPKDRISVPDNRMFWGLLLPPIALRQWLLITPIK